jgi:hypothetical protein
MGEMWYLTIREEHRLRVSEIRVLRRIFGPKREKVTGDWEKLHNEELHNLYFSPDIIRVMKSRMMRSTGNVTCMEEMRNANKISVQKPEWKRPFE